MSKFNVGDKVKYIGEDHNDMPKFYPEIGTIGTLMKECGDTSWYIQWPKGSTSRKDCWCCDENDIELVENVDMTNEEIWEMLRPKLNKNNLEGLYVRIDRYGYVKEDVYNAIATAYRSGYERAMKGRPFKIGERKKKEPMEYQSLAFKGKDGKWHLAPQPNQLKNPFFTKKKNGHWEPVDPENLPKEGTKVRYSRECGAYSNDIIKIGDTGVVVWEGMFTPMWFGIRPDSPRSYLTWIDFSDGVASCLDIWVEDNE